jgi:hypothetical protein
VVDDRIAKQTIDSPVQIIAQDDSGQGHDAENQGRDRHRNQSPDRRTKKPTSLEREAAADRLNVLRSSLIRLPVPPA